MLLVPGNRFLFLRHGETDYNRRGIRCGGEIDIPLNDTGLAQAERVGKEIHASGWPVHWIAASALLRVQQTANIISGYLQVPVMTAARLNERALGEWNGKTIAETEEAIRSGQTPPGGESNEAFRHRVVEWLLEWRPHFREPGLIIGSKGIARVLSQEFVGDYSKVANCELLLFQGSEQGNRLITSPLENAIVEAVDGE